MHAFSILRCYVTACLENRQSDSVISKYMTHKYKYLMSLLNSFFFFCRSAVASTWEGPTLVGS